MKYIFLTTWTLLFSFQILSQETSLDSLIRRYNQTSDFDTLYDLTKKIGNESENIEDAEAYFSKVALIVKSKPSTTQAKFFVSQSKMEYSFKEYSKAIKTVDAAIIILEKIADKTQLAKAVRYRGKYEAKALLFDEAILSFTIAEKLFEEVDIPRRQIDCLNRIGIIHKNFENYSEALLLYHKAYKLAESNNMEQQLAATSTNIGVVLKKQEQFEEAVKFYQQAEKYYLQNDDFYGLANIYNNIGNIHRINGVFEKALEAYDLAIIYRRKDNKLEQLSYTYNNMGLVYQEMDLYDKAIEYLEKSEEFKIKFEDIETLSSTYMNLSNIYLLKGDKEKYLYFSEKAMKIAVEYQQNDVRRLLLHSKSKFEADKGNYEAAYIHLLQVYNELDTVDLKSQRMFTSVLQAQFNSEQSENEIHELGDALALLDHQKKELESNQATLKTLLFGLSFVVLILIIMAVLFIRKQKALLIKTTELAVSNQQLIETTIGKEEKELLLREIHHRVKNNLQIIKSLIRLQNFTLEDEQSNAVLLDFEQRVSAMALVHESLYKSGDLAKVNVPDYFKRLIENLIDVYRLDKDIETEVNIENYDLGIDTLIPLGLLSTEIISNSIKYGTSKDKKCVIKVALSQDNKGEFVLLIGDNGAGFDIDEVSKRNTLGIELIQTLTEQLDGQFSYSNENGSYFTIIFKPLVKVSEV